MDIDLTCKTSGFSESKLTRKHTAKRRAKRVRKANIGLFYLEAYLNSISLEPVYSSVLEGIQRFCQNYNHQFQVLVVSDKLNGSTDTVQSLLKEFNGVVLIGEIPSAMINHIEKHNIPSVHFGSSSHYAANSSFVTPDNFEGAYLAVKHLVSLGHKRIAYISNNRKKVSFIERMRGYVAAMIDSKVKLREEYYKYGGEDNHNNLEMFETFLAMKEPPTALFCANDEIAFSILKYCAEEKIQVPQQLSVVGFDDTSFAEYSVPALTTVRQPMVQAGWVAAIELIESISNPDYIPRKVVLKTELIVRSSTGECIK